MAVVEGRLRALREFAALYPENDYRLRIEEADEIEWMVKLLLPSPVAGDAPGADTTEGGKDG